MENASQKDRIVSVLIFIVIFLAITTYMRGDWKIRIPSTVTRLFVNPDVDMHEESAVSLSSNDLDYDKAALDPVKSTKLLPLPENLPDLVNSGGLFSILFKHCGALSCLKLFACKRTRQLINTFKRCWFYHVQFATDFKHTHMFAYTNFSAKEPVI